MTEDEAKLWVAKKFDAATVERLTHFVDLLLTGTTHQNLIAPSTVDTVWVRHIVDSLQLLDLAPQDWSHWADIGSGAGLPGLVVATACDRQVTLIEPRRLRVEFLNACIAAIELSNVSVIQAKAETAKLDYADVVSARAVAKLDTLFAGSRRFTSPETLFILPKGESAHSEVATARTSWHGRFHVEQSIVDPKSGIVVARDVTRR